MNARPTFSMRRNARLDAAQAYELGRAWAAEMGLAAVATDVS